VLGYLKQGLMLDFTVYISCNYVLHAHGIERFVIPTKSFVKIGITKIVCHNNKMFSSINKTFRCRSKIFGCSKKKIVVPNFVAVTKPFFPCKILKVAFLPRLILNATEAKVN